MRRMALRNKMTDPELHNEETCQAVDDDVIDPYVGYESLGNDFSEGLHTAIKEFAASNPEQKPPNSWLQTESLRCFLDMWWGRFKCTPKESLSSFLEFLQSRCHLDHDELECLTMEYFSPCGALRTEWSPQELLDKLTDAPVPDSERRDLILQAEVATFENGQIEDLNQLLYRFILEKRNSNGVNDLIAVGSAIRKLAAIIRIEDLNLVGEILSPEHRTPIPLEIELEVAKVVARKLAQAPPVADDTEPELSARLMELVRTYLNPRLLSRQLYGATALNAILALLLLRAHQTQEVVTMLVELPSTWFAELVARRASRLRAQLLSRFPSQEFESYSKGLDAVLQALPQGQS